MMECGAAMLLAANAAVRDVLAEQSLPKGRIEIVCENDLEGITANFTAKGHYGQAFVTNKRELIVLADKMPEHEVIPTVEHELAHILTWRKYGLKVPVHGWQFTKTCARIATFGTRKTCG